MLDRATLESDAVERWEAQLRPRRRRIGQYLACVAVYQCLLAVAGATFHPLGEPALYLTPRFWTLFFADMSVSVSYGAALLSGLLSLALGWRLATDATATRLWIALLVEGVLALPTFLLLGIVFLANLSPAHGMSRAEIVIPSGIFAIASAAPLLAGGWIAWLGRRPPTPA